MKNSVIILAVIAFTSCVAFHYFNKEDISLNYTEDEKELSISAKFPDEKTTKVQNYLTKKLGDSDDFSFKNSRIDGKIALKDRTFFYIKLSEGRLKIEMQKKENSFEAYQKMKKVG
ncbi:MAG: hypothetical protein V4683_06065, partial [Bacteroidota bacterium]